MNDPLAYFIWSWEHRQWWRPDRQGYTPHLLEAGLYSASEAADITIAHIPPGEEVAVHRHWAMRYGPPPSFGHEESDTRAAP